MDGGEDLHAAAILPYEIADVLGRLVFDGELDAETWSDLAALSTQLRRQRGTAATYVHLAQQLDTQV